MNKIGIIGAGRMGNTHAGELSKIEGVKITGVYDPKAEAANAMNKNYGAKIFKSPSELVESPDVDAILICSPTYCHLEGIKAAAKTKKPVFDEKPMCRTADEIKEISKIIGKSGNPFTVGFVRRHMPKSQKVKEIIDSGAIGKIRFCNVELPFGAYKRLPGDWFTDFNLSGGVILDMLAHHVDLANWFFGKAKSVYASGFLLECGVKGEPSDYVASIATYENNVIVNFMCNWQRFGRSCEMMEIYGEKGAVSMDGSSNVTFYPKGKEKEVIATSEESGYAVQMKNLAAYLRGEKDLAVTLDDGAKSLELGLKMIESVKTGKVVKL